MMQTQLNAYGPRTTFVGRHPYTDTVDKPGNISGIALVQVVKDNPGCTSQEIFALIKKGSVNKIGSSLHLRVKHGDVHFKKIHTVHPSGKGATNVLHWYPGTPNDN